MDDSDHRRARTSDPTITPGPTGAGPGLSSRRSALWTRLAPLAAALTALALLAAPGAGAVTGGAPSAVPTPVAVPVTTPDGGGLSFGRFRVAGASWYGGRRMWGRHTACGELLRPNTIGVAHKRLPCGTPVKFIWHGRSIVAPVIDRGPFIRGRAWDLTAATAEALRFRGIGRIRYAIAIRLGSAGH